MNKFANAYELRAMCADAPSELSVCCRSSNSTSVGVVSPALERQNQFEGRAFVTYSYAKLWWYRNNGMFMFNSDFICI